MVWVSDDEAELVEGYRQEQADLAKKATNMGPFEPEMGPFEPSTPAYKSYIPASQKQQDTTGLDWFDAGGVSAYHDPKTGNTWGNGLWYDSGGNVWNDDAGAWQTPQEYNTFWSDIYQHDVGITGVMGMQAPESGPTGYDLFTDWSALTAPEPEMGPFEPYSLDFKQPSPILTKPWDLPFGMADRLIDADDDTGWGGPVGKILRKTGQVFADRTQRIPEIAPFLLRGLGATGGGNPSQEQLGEIYQKDILPNVSGNEFIRTFTPYDPDNLPGPLPYLTDALAPINFATAGIAPSAPFLGAMFKGPYLKNLAGEIGIDIGARLLSEQAAGERGEAIPFFGDQPAWLRALEGGLVGGLGAAGAIKGADVGIPAAMKYMGEEVEVAPGQFVKIGEFGGAKFGPVEPEPPKGIADAAAPKLAADAASATDARITLLDALDKERAFRESGEAEALIREGRATQAKGIAESIGETRGGTFEEALAGASAGARVGAMLPTTPGLSLSDDALGVITKELQDYALETGKTFDYLTAMKAVSKLQDGIHLQPAEIKQLGRVFGAEVEAAIRNTNAGRIATVAELTPEDLVKITRLAEADGKKAARAEVESQAQHKLADDLDRRLRMNPTNKRLATAASDARARAVKLEADSERYMLDRIERLESQAKAKTQRAETVANREEVRQAEMRDKQLAREEAAVRKSAEDEWVKSLDDQKPDAFARQLRAQEEREARALGKFQDRAKTVQAENVATQTYKESGAKALDKALATIDKTDLPDSVKATAKEAVEQWVKADGVVLDSMKGDAPGFLRVVYAGATGEVSDSWTSALIEQRGFMRGVLQDMGFDAKTADTISKALSEMEVLRRWGPEPPAHITKSLDQAKRSFGVGDNAITGLASISQEFKNIMFGIADIGIFGIQGLAAGAQGLAPMLAGTVNRVLNVARLGVDTSPGNLAKRVQYGLDGRIRGGATYTGAVDPTAGTLLRHIPGLKTIDQKYISRYIGAVNDLQFRHVMGFLGDLIHEGQLSMLKITGSDITDPLVRKQSAEFANAISSAGKLSQRSGRGNLERAFILSPSMVRSQMQVLGKIGRLLGPTTTRENRIMAASILVSYGATLAAVGKYLNDAIGTDDFEFDPSKPGAWQIRLSSGRMVNLFPQTQLFRLLAQSARVLAEEGQGEMDAERIGKAWLNFGIGRLSPAVSIGSSAAGVGFDPESGWRYGDLNHGKSWWEQLRDNVLPVPPLVDSVFREGLSAQGTTMSALGLSNYQESEWSAREREIKADPRFGGRGWNELEPSEKAIVNAEGGRVYSRDPEIRSQQERADVVAGDAKAYQEKIDQWFQTGQKPDGTPYTAEDWKRDRALNDKFVAGRYEELYAGVDWKKDDMNPVDLYYKAIADARDPLTDDVNWDKVDAWKAALSEEDRAYIERNTNLRDTVLEQQWRQDVKLLSDSGYFDAENKVAVRKADPEIAVAVRRWGYSEMSVKAEDVVMKYTAQQEVDDRALEQGQITPAQWHDNYNKRRDQLRAEKEGIYAGMKDDGVATDPLDAYFSEIDKAVKPNGIDIDWTRVDAWVAQQPADVQEVINTYVSPGLTPVVDQYKAAVNEIEESGYWTINDKVTAYWAKANGIDYPEGTNADAFWGEIQQEVYTKVKAKGYSTIEAQSLTNVVMGQLQKDYLEVAGKVRAAARDSSPELTRLLVSWGFWEPGKKDTAELLAAGTLR